MRTCNDVVRLMIVKYKNSNMYVAIVFWRFNISFYVSMNLIDLRKLESKI